MVTSKEKLEILSSLISNPIEQIDGNTVQEQLHELLLRDTTDGKLYKYRSFDSSGYSLKNLEDGTLHCSSALAFNDPFDCKIGVTYQSLYEAKYGTELDLISNILEKFILVVRDEINIEDCNVEEKLLIAKLMCNNRLIQFVKDNNAFLSAEEDTRDYLKDNAAVIVDLMTTVLSDPNIAPSLGVSAAMMPKLLANISEDGKLHILNQDSTLQDFAVANGIAEDADEIELILRLSNKINPELESAALDVQKLLDDWDQKVAGGIEKLFLIGCLCTSYKNRLMWSHYADSHKGFCIEYDFSKKSQDTLNQMPLPVIYSKVRPLIPWEAAFDKTPENMENAARQLTIGVLTKDSDWSYENEWRILIDAEDQAEVKMPHISCIYLGAAIEEENRNTILEIARRKQIPVKQMKVDRGEYALHAQTVLDFDEE